MRKTLILPLAAIALGAGGVAVAQAPATSEERTPARAMEHTRQQAEQRASTMFARLDVNGDGVLSEADRDARAEQHFDKINADGDSSISREEFAAQREDRGAGSGERMARREGRRGGPGMHGASGMLRAADADGNGTITQQEFITAALARFDAADADNDGTVTREEHRNAHPEGRHGRDRQRG